MPRRKLRFEAFGRGWSQGQTVMYPSPWLPVAVTFMVTAWTPDGGMPLPPLTDHH